MKVFELMSLLSEQPAGAEIKVRDVMTVAEFVENEALDMEGETNYQISKAPCGVEKITGNLIVIYL